MGGEVDIRMVLNGELSGLNDAIWSPYFDLFMVTSTLRVLKRGEFVADRDIGEMFLKFTFSEEVRPFCGVVISNVRTG